MQPDLRVAYFAHSVRSDWNNGNAHFVRGLLRELGLLGADVQVFEPENGWSYLNLLDEDAGSQALQQFDEVYAGLSVSAYGPQQLADERHWVDRLSQSKVVILHEWNEPALAQMLLRIRRQVGFKLLFHDTHHRASSSPAQIREFGLGSFDGVLAFGEALARIYREQFLIHRVWTLHEAADIAVFRPIPGVEPNTDVVWVGNWGDEERSAEIRQFLLRPAAALQERTFHVYGVRYPQHALRELDDAGVKYLGYLANLCAPQAYAKARLTVHIPRQQYVGAMTGIPTIRVFEALACGVPLLTAPWQDSEELFRPGDFIMVNSSEEMRDEMKRLLHDPRAAHQQAQQGLETVLSRHTCAHRAQQLVHICEDLLS